ncbi:efflux RND transporter periplasmic adaptor subunit [Ferrovibrio sp.]|uniref:efflux RND transporter periplasmic adaptor subunit n=1 Tax=Ferrovibrio sp. TaxID=1917215 RepID=UPI0025B828BB|nr:efflux RND transporter periplasmic adaptor subunit [Ferrovibrio sp.]MBX3453197.1 efflux RND transporter periplasmic adaptor subunit [Ferrovibrio sp.]
MKLWGQIALIAALGAAGTGAYLYRDKIPFLTPPSAAPQAVRAGGGGPPALPVETAAVKRMDVVRTLEAVGTAQSNEAVNVTAKANGIVDRINFQEGQLVKTGSILVELEAGESNAKLAELRAARDAARLAYDRATALAESRSVAQARVDDLSKAFEAAEARLRGEQAKFADSVIRAPFSGKLGMRRVSLGALVRPGDVITTLDDTSLIKLEFEVPETALSGIAVGNAVTATASATPGRKFQGNVTVINSRVDPTTRAIKVRAQIPNADDAIKPGMFMTVALSIGTSNNAIVVPEEALLAQGGEQFVYVIRDGRASRTRVRIGQRLPGMAQILEGLDADARVAITGLQQLRDGMAVRPPGPPPGQQPAPATAAKPAAS